MATCCEEVANLRAEMKEMVGKPGSILSVLVGDVEKREQKGLLGRVGILGGRSGVVTRLYGWPSAAW
jgi:hypothetical protein